MKNLITFILLLSLSGISWGAGYPEQQAGDTRKVRSATSPLWLEAVGQSTFLKKGYDKPDTLEKCSWSIIADEFDKDGIIVSGAGHCIDHFASGMGGFDIDTPTPITWISNDGKTITRQMVEILLAETHQGDYVIAKLDSYIPKEDIQPLIVSPWSYLDLITDRELLGDDGLGFATAAGYSADTGMGQKGKVLTYDERCRLSGGASGLRKSYCYSYSGASGGPVVVTVTLTPRKIWDDEDTDILYFFDDIPNITYGTYTFFCGTIVGSRTTDNSGAMFTEIEHYIRKLRPILAGH